MQKTDNLQTTTKNGGYMHIARKVCWSLLVFTLVLAFTSIGSAYGMKIIVVTSAAKTVAVQAEPEDSVADVKEFVFNVVEIHPENQMMFKGDTLLDNSKTLASYGISDGDTLTVSYGRNKSASKDKGSGGLVKIVVIIVILAVIVTVVKKKIFTT